MTGHREPAKLWSLSVISCERVLGGCIRLTDFSQKEAVRISVNQYVPYHRPRLQGAYGSGA
jgi:hypothetical protein